MIHFATSRKSYDQLAASSAWPPSALWVAHGVLSSPELADLRASGLAVTDFTNPFDSSDQMQIADALVIIREHHPGQIVCVDGSVAA